MVRSAELVKIEWVRRFRWRAAVWGCLLGTAAVAAAPEPALNTLRARHEETLAGIARETAAAYSNALAKLEVQLKRAGDLDGYDVLRAEKAFFAAKRLLPEAEDRANLVGKLPGLEPLLGQVEAQRDAKLAAAWRQYIITLGERIRQLMVADRIEDARVIKSESDRAREQLAALCPQDPPEDEAAVAPEAEPPPKAMPWPGNAPPPRQAPPDNLEGPSSQVLRQKRFRVFGSQIDSGVWRPCGVRVEAGEWVRVEVEAAQTLSDSKPQEARVMFRLKSDRTPACSLHLSDEVRRATFMARHADEVVYATENKLACKIEVTVLSGLP